MLSKYDCMELDSLNEKAVLQKIKKLLWIKDNERITKLRSPRRGFRGWEQHKLFHSDI